MSVISGHFVQSTTETNIVAGNSTLTYGNSVLLNITTESSNDYYSPISPPLSTGAIYTAYIYGGDLPDGLSIQLYLSDGEDTFPPHCAMYCLGHPLALKKPSLPVWPNALAGHLHVIDVHESLCALLRDERIEAAPIC